MRSLEEWLELYAESHKNKTNKIIHNICVPVITFTVLGILWEIPTPKNSPDYLFLNFSTLFGVMALIFYARLSLQTFLIMTIQLGFFLLICANLSQRGHLFTISLSLFILAWIGQFIGHKIEGKKPSFFQDIQFLLIGPIWVVKSLTGYPKTN